MRLVWSCPAPSGAQILAAMLRPAAVTTVSWLLPLPGTPPHPITSGFLFRKRESSSKVTSQWLQSDLWRGVSCGPGALLAGRNSGWDPRGVCSLAAPSPERGPGAVGSASPSLPSLAAGGELGEVKFDVPLSLAQLLFLSFTHSAAWRSQPESRRSRPAGGLVCGRSECLPTDLGWGVPEGWRLRLGGWLLYGRWSPLTGQPSLGPRCPLFKELVFPYPSRPRPAMELLARTVGTASQEVHLSETKMDLLALQR